MINDLQSFLYTKLANDKNKDRLFFVGRILNPETLAKANFVGFYIDDVVSFSVNTDIYRDFAIRAYVNIIGNNGNSISTILIDDSVIDFLTKCGKMRQEDIDSVMKAFRENTEIIKTRKSVNS